MRPLTLRARVTVKFLPSTIYIGRVMDILIVLGLIASGLALLMYCLYRFVGWALDINLPDGEINDSSDSES